MALQSSMRWRYLKEGVFFGLVRLSAFVIAVALGGLLFYIFFNGLGAISWDLHFDFVMGLKGAIPATIENLVHLKNSIPAGSTWTVAGIGPAQLVMNTHAILMGGHARIGLEDNIYFRKGELAPNERFVERMVKLAVEFGRGVSSPDEARQIMHLQAR